MKIALISLAVVLILIVGVVAGLAYYIFISLPNQELGYVTSLNAQYVMNQNDLSEFISGYDEQFGAYASALKGLDTFMVDAVKGRYDVRDAAGNPTGDLDAGLFINVIVEAYPDTTGITDLAQRLMDYIAAQRAEFKNNQDKLLDMLRVYDAWRQERPRCYFLNMAGGNPSDRLVARIGGQTYTGQEALDKMWTIVLASDAKEAFETGTMEPLTPLSSP